MVLLVGLTWPGSAAAQSSPPSPDGAARVRVARSTLVVAAVDQEAGALSVLEMLTLQNDGNTPYRPGRWEDSVIRLPLPANAQDVAFETGLADAQLVPVQGGYVLGAPLPPGEQPLVISYRLPYAPAARGGGGVTGLTIRRNLALPAGRAQVLVPELPGLELRPLGPALARDETRVMGSQRFLAVAGEQLPAGADVSVELWGLPVAAGRPGASVPRTETAARLALAAVALSLAAGAGYGLRRGRASAAQPSGDGWRLTEGYATLEALDADHAAGNLTGDEYEEARLRLKARLLHAVREQERQSGDREPGRVPVVSARAARRLRQPRVGRASLAPRPPGGSVE